MTDEEFAKSIGATKVDSTSDQDFAKSIGATPVSDEQDSWLGKYKDADIGPMERALRHPFQGGLPGNYDSGDDNAPWYQKLNDLKMAATHTVLQIPAGIVDTLWHPVASLTGAQENPMSNLVENLRGAPTTSNEQTYNNNINTGLSQLDPGLLLNHPPTSIEPLKALGKEREVPTPITSKLNDLEAAKELQAVPITDEEAFWKQRAENMANQAKYEQKQSELPPEKISVNQEGNAGTPEDMEGLSKSTEGITYENLPPDSSIPGNSPSRGITVPKDVSPRWVEDENGIPVRQGVPEAKVAPEYVNRYMRQDEPARNDLGNAIQEANGPKLGVDDAYGSEPLQGHSTGSPLLDSALDSVAPTKSFRGPGKNQRGSIELGIDPEQIRKLITGASDLIKKGVDSFDRFSKVPMARVVGMLPQDHMRSIPGMKESLDGLIPQPKSGQEFAAQALAEGKKNPSIPVSLQSGPALAGEKFNSAALKGVGQWLQYAANKTAFKLRNNVQPVEKSFTQLSRNEFQDLHKVMMSESERGALYDQGDLAKTLSPKQLEAYKGLRTALDDTWQMSVDTRKKLGLPDIPKLEGYAASMRHGDWSLPVYTKDGRLVWHVASTTKAHSNRALDWISKQLGDKIDLEKSQPMFKPDKVGVGVPKDIISGYHEMLKYFDKDDPTTTLISDSITKYNEEHGLTSRKHNERFMNKAGIPGFEGNKPWLSPQENANNFFQAQVGYLKNSVHWNHLQEALGQIKDIISNPELIKNQPNIIRTAAAFIDRETGVSKNMLKGLEMGIAKVVPSITIGNGKINTGIGISRSSLYRATSDIKSGVYLQQLGFNPGYMIATPLQGLLSVALHRYLSNKGMKHQVFNTMLQTMRDSSGALMQHYLHQMSGKSVDMGPLISDLGKRALQFAEDNNVINKTIMDEYQTLGEHKVWGAVKNRLSGSITTPEKVGRLTTFMSFAHHLVDSGLPEPEAFRQAAEFTNHAMTSMERHDRPLAVDKLGVLGEMAYQYHSYLFNEAHQLSLLSRHAIENKAPGPLMAHVGALMFLGGALALPLVNEMDGVWNLTKDFVANVKPEWYKPISGLGLKGSMINGINDFASGATVSGPLTQLTGVALGQRFSMQVLDPEHPLQQIAAAPQEAREWVSAGKVLTDPTKRNLEQAAWVNSPPLIKGQMETRLNDFKNPNLTTDDGRNPNGTMSYRKASDINNVSTDYKRTPEEEKVKGLGLTSQSEYNTKTLRYINNQEQARIKTAATNLLDKMVTRAMDGDSVKAQLFARKAMELLPQEGQIQDALSQAILDRGLTPEERDKVKATSLPILEKVMRVQHATH